MGISHAFPAQVRHVVRGRPLRYRVVRPGGAMIRATSSLDGAEVGLAPAWTSLDVSERVRLPGGTLRLRIVAPAKWAGWASEKEHIVRREPSRAELAADARSRERSRRRRVRRERDDREKHRLKVLDKKRVAWVRDDERRAKAAVEDEACAAVVATFACSTARDHVIDRRECGPGVAVSDDLLTATCTAPRFGRGLALAAKCMRTGLHYWEVRVERATWGSVFVGVAALGAGGAGCGAPGRSSASYGDAARGLGGAAGGWGAFGFVNYRATQAFGAEALYGSYYGPGDVVGVLLDCDRGTLAFVKDGDDFNAGRAVVSHLGVAYANLWRRYGDRAPASRAGLYACLGLKGDGDRLSFREGKSWSSDGGGGGFERALAALRRVRDYDAALNGDRAAVAGPLADFGAAAAARWLATYDAVEGGGTTVTARSRARVDVDLDASAGAFERVLSRAGLVLAEGEVWPGHGAPCSTPHGPGALVGVCGRGHLWYAASGVDDDRAWYWTPGELRAHVEAGKVRGATTKAAAGDAAAAAAAAAFRGGGAAAFAWTADATASLVRAVDDVARRERCSPFLVPPSKLAAALGVEDGKVGARGALRGAPAAAVAARLGALLHLNACVAEAVACVDLGRGDLASAELGESRGGVRDRAQPRGRGARRAGRGADDVSPPAEDLDAEALLKDARLATARGRRRGDRGRDRDGSDARGSADDDVDRRPRDRRAFLATSYYGARHASRPPRGDDEAAWAGGDGPDAWWAGAAPARTDVDEQLASGVPALNALLRPAARSACGRALLRLKNCVFDDVKRDHWAAVLAATTTFTPPPPDEYDRPDELREFVVNRLDPADDPESDDAEARSVFGQLRRQMASRADARGLRRSFVHMQDGGQPRAFYVKFVGEGVDDHGGPYRAVFQAALGDEPAAPLRLVAGERGALAPASGAPALFHHFGRLLGVAGRHKVPVALELSRGCVWAPLSGAPRAVRARADDASGALAASLAELRRFAAGGARPCDAAVDALADALAGDAVDALAHPAFAADVVAQRLAAASRPALARVARGAAAVLPAELFALFDAEGLDDAVTGRARVDVDDLRARTSYEGVDEADAHVAVFWDALRSLDEAELAGFVEFCSGSARPPRADAPRSTQALKITPPPPGADGDDPDGYFPVASTCFFSLALPKYTCAAACAAKLKYAIKHAHLMDADFLLRHADGWEAVRS